MVKYSRFPDIGNLELLHAAYQKQKFTPHFHEGHAIGVVEKGCLAFDYRGEKVAATQGEINVADPGEVHNGYAVSNQGWQYRMFYLKPGQLGRICNDLYESSQALPIFKKGVIKDPCFAGQIQLLHQDFENHEISLLEKQSRFHGLMTTFILRHAPKKRTLRPVGSEPAAVLKIKEYIESFYDVPISLKALSRLTGFSRFYLLRVFAQKTGMTPHTYLNFIRATKARDLMAGKVSIAEAAHRVGFFDQSHLNRVFKKIFGITPGQFCRIEGPDRSQTHIDEKERIGCHKS